MAAEIKRPRGRPRKDAPVLAATPQKPKLGRPAKTPAVVTPEPRGRGALAAQVGLTVKDFEGILSLCQSFKVAVLQFGTVRVEFREGLKPGESITTPDETSHGTGVQNRSPVEGATAAGAPSVAFGDLDSAREAEMAQRMIDDPGSFEQEIIDGHLREGVNVSAQDRGTQSLV